MLNAIVFFVTKYLSNLYIFKVHAQKWLYESN